MVAPRPQPIGFHVYCDESCTTAHRYMVYGGIITPTNNLASLHRRIADWRAAHNMHRELKWEKVSRSKYPEYMSLVELIFSLVHARRLHFRAMVVDTHDPNYRVSSRDNWDLGFYKFYYWFLLNNFAVYAHDRDCDMQVFVDQRPMKGNRLEVLHIILNRGIRKRFALARDLVKSIQECDSKTSDLLQLADVIMGAVGFHNNEKHRQPNAAKHKIDLADLIARKMGRRDLMQDTPYTRGNFRVLRWAPSERATTRRNAVRGVAINGPRTRSGDVLIIQLRAKTSFGVVLDDGFLKPYRPKTGTLDDAIEWALTKTKETAGRIFFLSDGVWNQIGAAGSRI